MGTVLVRELNQQRSHSCVDVVSNGPDHLQRLARGIINAPIQIPPTRVERARIAATHRDHHVGGFHCDEQHFWFHIVGSVSAGKSTTIKPMAMIVPTSCITMNIGADDGLIPANVLDSVRATVTAGLANEVDDVNQ